VSPPFQTPLVLPSSSNVSSISSDGVGVSVGVSVGVAPNMPLPSIIMKNINITGIFLNFITSLRLNVPIFVIGSL
jgi:hypothetical protein